MEAFIPATECEALEELVSCVTVLPGQLKISWSDGGFATMAQDLSKPLSKKCHTLDFAHRPQLSASFLSCLLGKRRFTIH